MVAAISARMLSVYWEGSPDARTVNVTVAEGGGGVGGDGGGVGGDGGGGGGERDGGGGGVVERGGGRTLQPAVEHGVVPQVLPAS